MMAQLGAQTEIQLDPVTGKHYYLDSLGRKVFIDDQTFFGDTPNPKSMPKPGSYGLQVPSAATPESSRQRESIPGTVSGIVSPTINALGRSVAASQAAPAAAPQQAMALSPDSPASSGGTSVANMQAVGALMNQAEGYGTSEGLGTAGKIGGTTGTAVGGGIGAAVGGGPAGAMIGGAVGGGLGAGVGSILDYVMSYSQRKREYDNRVRTEIKKKEIERQKAYLEYRRQQMENAGIRDQQRAIAQQRMADVLAAYLSRKSSELIRTRTVNAPVSAGINYGRQ